MAKRRMLNRKGEEEGGSGISTLVKVILILGFLLVMILVFFGKGLIPQAFDKIREVIRGAPEVDSTKTEQDFYRNMDNQIQYTTDIVKALNRASASKDQQFCFVELPAMDTAGFYKKDFSLYFDKTDAGMNVRLTLTKAQDTQDKGTEGTQTPVTAATIPGAQPCVIIGSAVAAEFYTQFNDRKAGQAEPNVGKITPTPVSSLLLSSVQTDGQARYIGYKLTEDYVWEYLFKKNDRTIVYVMKMSMPNGKDYMCFFPTERKGVRDSCTSTTSGFVDIDCFDRNAVSRSLAYNFNNGLLDQKKYACNGGAASANAAELQGFADILKSCAATEEAKYMCLCTIPAMKSLKRVEIYTNSVRDPDYNAEVQTSLSVFSTQLNQIVINADTTRENSFLISNQDTISPAPAEGGAAVADCPQST